MGGSLETTYDVHFVLIWKARSRFPVRVNSTFSLDVTAKALRAKINRKSAISLQRGQFDPKFQVDGDVPHQSFLHG